MARRPPRSFTVKGATKTDINLHRKQNKSQQLNTYYFLYYADHKSTSTQAVVIFQKKRTKKNRKMKFIERYAIMPGRLCNYFHII